MKKIIFGLLMATTLLSSTCKKDDDTPAPTTGVQPAAVTTAVTSNTAASNWRVTLYNEAGTVKTSSFTGYTFNFASNSTVTATVSGATTSGTWSSLLDSGRTKLIISFNVTNGYLEEISEDWEVISATNNKIELKHISGGNGTTDLLTLER
jgi:hypothetical protein